MRPTTCFGFHALLVLIAGSLTTAGAAPITVFNADFEGSTPNTLAGPAPDDDGIGGGSETNTNAGTSVGSWDGAHSSNLFGAVYANAGGTNNALALDTGLSGNTANVIAFLDQTVDLTTDNVLIEFDLLSSRQANNRRVEFGIGQGATNAYRLVFAIEQTKRLGFNASGSNTFVASANAGPGDALVNVTSGGGNAPTQLAGEGEMIHVQFSISPGATSADRTALLSVDWDGDGDFTDDVTDVTNALNAPVAFRNGAVDTLNQIRITGSGNPRGVWLDNIVVTAEAATVVPEPAAVALFALPFVAACGRRRR